MLTKATYHPSYKTYELTNHLGNVMSTISDRKVPVDDASNNILYFLSDVDTYQDYFPFGMVMSERSGSKMSAEYRYGFGGHEEDNEITGNGNFYTTYYRGLDVRTGRWISVDPKFYLTSDMSSYAAFGNNPVWNIDLLGDTFDPVSQKRIDKFKASTNKRIENVQSEIRELNEIISFYQITEQDASEFLPLLESLEKRHDELSKALEEVTELEFSEQGYSIVSVSGAFGGVNMVEGVVVARFVNDADASLAHELKHLYQYEMGELSFIGSGTDEGSPGLLYDIFDEVEAYRRQWAYGGMPKSLRHYSWITVSNIIALDVEYDTQYSILYRHTTLSVNSIVTERVLRHYFGDSYKSQENQIGTSFGDYIQKLNELSEEKGGGNFENVK